jgi:hypothetical protein
MGIIMPDVGMNVKATRQPGAVSASGKGSDAGRGVDRETRYTHGTLSTSPSHPAVSRFLYSPGWSSR